MKVVNSGDPSIPVGVVTGRAAGTMANERLGILGLRVSWSLRTSHACIVYAKVGVLMNGIALNDEVVAFLSPEVCLLPIKGTIWKASNDIDF